MHDTAATGERDARHVRVAVVGSGFAGLGTAIRLLRQGRRDLVVFERAEDVGGTWRDNAYPGCQCDVPSHLYSFSFAPNPSWTRTYSPQREIQDYLRRCASEHGVLPFVRFGHEVRHARWDAGRRRWEVETNRGTWTADVLVAGQGGLSEPAVPDLPGLDEFEGVTFHTARWDHDVDLAGKRVAVIGTGATAVQIVPRLARQVAHLDLFQRTPPWVLPHTDRPTTPFERALYRRVPTAQRAVRVGVYWLRELLFLAFARPSWLTRRIERLASAHLRRQVADPDLRARLTPHYAAGCKRLLLSNDYYPTLGRSHVELVDQPIESVTPTGIRTADGVEHQVDVIVLATGFRVTDHPFLTRVAGADGRTLAEHWADTGMRAYLGTTVPGFPNLFLLSGPNTGIGHTSLVFMVEAQIDYLLDALSVMDRLRLRSVEVRADVFESYNRWLQDRMRTTVWAAGRCASWYLDEAGRNTTLWPDFTWRFRARTRRFHLSDYELVPLDAPAPEPAEVA